eukprot:scaffold1609_cov252-Pinguiococcus_pyrenoidosus.AAC.1
MEMCVLGDQFGQAVAVSGNTIAVSASSFDDHDHEGVVYIFRVTEWTDFDDSVFVLQVHRLTGGPSAVAPAPDTQLLNVLAGTVAMHSFNAGEVGELESSIQAQMKLVGFERFGISLDINENLLIIGAPPAAYLFSHSGSGNAVAIARIGDPAYDDPKRLPSNLHDHVTLDRVFGYSVALHGDRIVVGAPSTVRESPAMRPQKPARSSSPLAAQVEDTYLTGKYRRNPAPWEDATG